MTPFPTARCVPTWDRLRQHAGAVVLLLQLFVVGAAPLLDARSDRLADDFGHVEEVGREVCAPIHDPEECQLCRVIRVPFAAAPRASVPLDGAVAAWRGAGGERVTPAVAVVDGRRSRAPPAGA